MKYWSKTILSIFNYLEEMSETLDKIVNDTAVRSNNRTLMDYQTTTYQTNKIIELTDRKRKILNLKVIVENTINKISNLDNYILKLAYIEGIKSEFIAQMLNVSLRTFFRLKTIAIENFKYELIKMGYGLDFFKKEYECEKWIVAIYNNYISKSIHSSDALDATIIRYAIREVPKINLYKKVGVI